MNKLLFLFFCFPLFLLSQNQNQIGQDIDGQNQNDYFGHSVSMNYDGSIVAIGVPYNDDNGQWNGQVSIFEIPMVFGLYLIVILFPIKNYFW